MALLNGGRSEEETAFRQVFSEERWQHFNAQAGQVAGFFRDCAVCLEPKFSALKQLLSHFAAKGPVSVRSSVVFQVSHAEVFFQFEGNRESALVRLAVPVSLQEVTTDTVGIPLSSGAAVLAIENGKIRVRLAYLRADFASAMLKKNFPEITSNERQEPTIFTILPNVFYHMTYNYEV